MTAGCLAWAGLAWSALAFGWTPPGSFKEVGLSLSTPTLLFGAISLIMLAYTNRFFSLGQLIRALIAQRGQGESGPSRSRMVDTEQIKILKKRLHLMVVTQALGVLSFILCSASTLVLFFGKQTAGSLLFVASVMVLMVSLIYFLWEILISTRALNIVIDCYERETN